MAKEKAEISMSLFDVPRKTLWHLQKMKEQGIKITMVGTAYMDPMFTTWAQNNGADLVRYTAPAENNAMRVTNIKWWTRMQRKQAPKVHLNAVLQTQQYADPITAVKESVEILGDGADSVMPMGITNEALKAMADNYVGVFGHVGTLSGWQTGRFGGYRKCGKTAEDALHIYHMAYEYQENGMAGMTIELTPTELTDFIAKKLTVPVINVAAGGAADGSEMVVFDLLGFIPRGALAKHSKAYTWVRESASEAFAAWNEEVKSGAYPAEEHGWHMDEEELDKFMKAVDNE